MLCDKCQVEDVYLHEVTIDGYENFEAWLCQECKYELEELINDWLEE